MDLHRKLLTDSAVSNSSLSMLLSNAMQQPCIKLQHSVMKPRFSNADRLAASAMHALVEICVYPAETASADTFPF